MQFDKYILEGIFGVSKNIFLLKNICGNWVNLLVCWKILVNLKELSESKALMVLSQIYLIWKSICRFYILENASNMTCTTSWYSDIVYSDHVVRVRVFGKHFFLLWIQTLHVETYRNLLKKYGLNVSNSR